MKFTYGTIIFLILAIAALVGCDQQESRTSPDSTPADPQPLYQGTIITVGNSLTAGLGVDETEAWPNLVAKAIQDKGYNWQVINAGISGETSSGALSRIKWILARKPDIVILQTGANDGLRGIPVEIIRKNITNAVTMMQQEGTVVVLAGMQIVQNLGPEYTENFAAIFPAVAQETGCILIPFLLQDVAGEPSLNLADTIHPNEEGHKIIAETVLPSILNALRQNFQRQAFKVLLPNQSS